jgi:hypothetical protein
MFCTLTLAFLKSVCFAQRVWFLWLLDFALSRYVPKRASECFSDGSSCHYCYWLSLFYIPHSVHLLLSVLLTWGCRGCSPLSVVAAVHSLSWVQSTLCRGCSPLSVLSVVAAVHSVLSVVAAVHSLSWLQSTLCTLCRGCSPFSVLSVVAAVHSLYSLSWLQSTLCRGCSPLSIKCVYN